MKPIYDEAYARYLNAPRAAWWQGQRVKEVRHQPLWPGGRTEVTLFERVGTDDRAHPRLRTRMPPALDPSPPESMFEAPTDVPATAEALQKSLEQAIEAAGPKLAGADLDASKAPAESPHFWRNSIRVQRTAQLFSEARGWLQTLVDKGLLPTDEVPAARYALKEVEDLAYAGDIQFDDGNTSTYHSFGHDAPFVHYLERIIDTLPATDSRGFALLPPQHQEAIRQQREQAHAHLDYLMRHKYAYDGVKEMDIEQSVGGFLIDRKTRHIVSETEASRDVLEPAFELLRIAPGTDHPHAGEYCYRDAQGQLHLSDGADVTVAAEALRSIPIPANQITFRRAPKDAGLRADMRLDWDGNGYVQKDAISWVSWAGHCDIKAIMEQLGIVLADKPTLEEYRSGRDTTEKYDRALLIEMIASVLELGSVYLRSDGSGRVSRGIHRFGGARNDSRPDRLQFQGLGAGRAFRWPLSGRKDRFEVAGVAWEEGAADMATVFSRYLPDTEGVDFADNPRYIKTVEGDYNIIDVSSARLEAVVKTDAFDPDTGYLIEDQQNLILDLGPDGATQRYLLGTHVDDPVKRRIYRVYLDRAEHAIVAELDVYERQEGQYTAIPKPDEVVRIPLAKPMMCTLSREMKWDDPAVFQSLLGVACRQAQNINADTDMEAAVWNGTVTRIRSQRIAVNREARVERWRFNVTARFGKATLEYFVRRDTQGEPVAYCPLPEVRRYYGPSYPDFFWQDLPDVGTKSFEDGDWLFNANMAKREIITMSHDSASPGGVYVHDEHIKSIYEMIFCALGGFPWTIVHNNQRYGFADEATWSDTVWKLRRAREEVRFVGEHPRRRLNVNAVSASVLEAIPGIGPHLARAVVENRTAHGEFSSVDELTRVSGVGSTNIERFRPYLAVTGDEGPPPIDPNTATHEELDGLPGIGAASARAIVAHREAHGRFASVDDLLEISGIGPRNLEVMRPYLVVVDA